MTFDPARSFGRTAFDRVFISYAVSMIPAWELVLENAVARLAPGSELHVVDFGDLQDRPAWQKSALYTWLQWYHVTPRATLFHVSSEIAQRHGCTTQYRRLYHGFTWIATIRRPDRLLTVATTSLEREPQPA